MVSAIIKRRESEKPSVSGKTFPLLRLSSPQSIDEISKCFVFSASLVRLFFELLSTLRAQRPRADCAPSGFLGFRVAVIAEITNHFVSAINNDYIFVRHVIASFLGREIFTPTPVGQQTDPINCQGGNFPPRKIDSFKKKFDPVLAARTKRGRMAEIQNGKEQNEMILIF